MPLARTVFEKMVFSTMVTILETTGTNCDVIDLPRQGDLNRPCRGYGLGHFFSLRLHYVLLDSPCGERNGPWQ